MTVLNVSDKNINTTPRTKQCHCKMIPQVFITFNFLLSLTTFHCYLQLSLSQPTALELLQVRQIHKVYTWN